MNIATITLTSLLSAAPTARADAHTATPITYAIPARDTTPQAAKIKSLGPSEAVQDSSKYETHLPHMPHERHAPLTLHRSKISALGSNFPYDHLLVGVHAKRKHIGFEVGLVLGIEPHSQENHVYVVRHTGVGIGLSYHR